MEMIKALFVIE